jgi:uncharacterized protein
VGLIYVDSCLLIYGVERHSHFGPIVIASFENPDVAGRLAISALVKAECLVGPFKRQQPGVVQDFQNSFAQLTTLPIIDEDFIAAARLRARFGLKLADALHLAIAQRHGCTALWTNDDRLTVASGGLAVAI